jgi:hypothetical protein
MKPEGSLALSNSPPPVRILRQIDPLHDPIPLSKAPF